ncbi:hypothetical protein DUI87_17695 [Hirundo rustica rustica]|uniref:Uncharacterized protein n=1 Tax=Hirundo rustica rustica TaxID=333673 RepID=A0A3M0K303_HIRRU|nr:hypothetical protein DUI87_17695 [Hirundo rustica rustica]
MAYLAAGGNPVGRGKGRGIHLWVTLVILSLAMYLMSGLPNPKGEMGKETDPQESQSLPGARIESSGSGSNLLGAPLYETLSRKRRETKRELPQAGGNQKWRNEEWPAECIIEYYGLATWAQDGSWGYQTPVYLLN